MERRQGLTSFAEIWAAVAAVLHGLAATAVTAHVLLKKRDVRSAIAWIGVAWLSPGLGAVLYFVFGINRVVRRAVRIRRRVARSARAHGDSPLSEAAKLPRNIAAIAGVGERATGFPLTSGNRLTSFRGGDEAYPAMLDAIGGAERSVALASYIFRADSVGQSFVAALGKAQARGVETRVLVDGVGGGYLYSPIARRLKAAGVTYSPFLQYWLPWRMPFLNMRNHKKLLIVDGRQGFTGGLNLGAENLAATRPQRRVDDIHFRVEGPVVRQLMVTFAEDWRFMTGESLEGELWWPEIPPAGSVLAHGISSGPDEDIGVLASILATAVGEAERRVRIVTPYFLPDQTLSACLTLAALRGVEVEILLPERSDFRALDWAMRAHLGWLAAPGIAIHLSPGPFDHSKLMTVDGGWSLLGSANWDVRSSRLNFEFNLACYDRETTAALDQVIDRKIAGARRLSSEELDGRRMAVRLRDAAARLMLPYL
ncbi:MAG TPA: phospholipase D-like domain-containing protein [Dongiaceae bacterium]|nr:phospholipase D-like domain-containing protein [Dongiaceae bacterium]